MMAPARGLSRVRGVKAFAMEGTESTEEDKG
jgi:hypothetical protein